MKALILRLDSPLMSFGSVIVDQHGYIDRFPGTAMLCGLVANALGWNHDEFDRLQILQARLLHASRWDVTPIALVDYHTVDLGQDKMREPGWTTRGEPEHRRGGTAAKFGTHQRYRHYWADGLMTVALTLVEGQGPSLEEVKAALTEPCRPIFIGRKTCLPSRPLLDPITPIVEGEDLLSILRTVPVWARDGTLAEHAHNLEASWPADIGLDGRGETKRVYDLRDWANQIPSGSRLRVDGLLRRE